LPKEQRVFNLENRLIEFSVSIIRIVETLPKTRIGNHIAGQLIRSGTSPASNYGEAQSAESRTDFIHKMKVCLKELRETKIWLVIIDRAKLLKDQNEIDLILNENNELISIFVKSIKTAQDKKIK
jgi:four helix bundle protein